MGDVVGSALKDAESDLTTAESQRVAGTAEYLEYLAIPGAEFPALRSAKNRRLSAVTFLRHEFIRSVSSLIT